MGIRYENFVYQRLLERIEISFLDMFNNVKVNRYSDIKRNVIVKTIKVPIVAASYDKDFANWYQNQQAAKKLMPLPIMGLRLKGLTPNSKGRTQSTYARSIFSKADKQWLNDIQPTPYFANYTLHTLCDNRGDLGQLIENILPYFNPQRCLRIKEFPAISDLERKIQVELIGSTLEFKDELKNEAQHRYIAFDIDFKLEIEMYRKMSIAELITYGKINITTDMHTDEIITTAIDGPLVAGNAILSSNSKLIGKLSGALQASEPTLLSNLENV